MVAARRALVSSPITAINILLPAVWAAQTYVQYTPGRGRAVVSCLVKTLGKMFFELQRGDINADVRPAYRCLKRQMSSSLSVRHCSQLTRFLPHKQTMCPDVFRGIWGGSHCRDSPVQTIRECSCAQGTKTRWRLQFIALTPLS